MDSTIGSAQTAPVHGHHHHGRAAAAQPADPFATSTAASASTNTTASSSATAATPGIGLQKFASELQSILLRAQSGQPSAAGTTASNPATATDPAGAADPTVTSQAGPIRHLADRLQDLLTGGTSQAARGTATTANQPQDLQSLLNTLQQTLQHTLASYGAQTTSTPATTVTA